MADATGQIPFKLDPEVRLELEQAATEIARTLTRNMITLDEGTPPPTNGAFPGFMTTWGPIMYTAVRVLAPTKRLSDDPLAPMLTEYLVDHYILQALLAGGIVAQKPDAPALFPLLLRRAAVLLGAEPHRIIETRARPTEAAVRAQTTEGRMVETGKGLFDGNGGLIAGNGHVIPVGRNLGFGPEVITVRWPARGESVRFREIS